MKNTPLILLFSLFGCLQIFQNPLAAQTLVDGYIFEENNRGYLNQVKIVIYRLPENAVLPDMFTDAAGHFEISIPPGRYRFLSKKDVFFDHEDTVEIAADKVFLKIEMRRKPGYLFDATIAEARTDPDQVVDAVQGATIEIYNRTAKKVELVYKQHKDAFFQHTLEQGNHYSILIRKPGYLAKRIEAYVNVKGCIICVDGVANLRPGVTENLTAGNTMGTLLCNIDMEKVRLDKRIGLQNIYYDYDKWDIRPDAAVELDKAVRLMMDNPTISVELGSHTDARGGDSYNLELSQKRAESAVGYIVSEGVSNNRISAKGYGETEISNRCKNGVTCSEEEHQANRRTELRITGISKDSLEEMRWSSLEEIVREEDFKTALRGLENQQEVKIEEKPAPKTEEKPKPKTEEKTELKKDKKVEAKIESKTELKKDEKVETKIKNKVKIDEPVRRPALQPEANNSVVLPKFEPVASISPKKLSEDYTGYNVEIARTDIELTGDHPMFNQAMDVFYQKDGEGLFYYFLGDFDNQAVARNYFQMVVLPKFPTAKLCEFVRGVKNYSK